MRYYIVVISFLFFHNSFSQTCPSISLNNGNGADSDCPSSGNGDSNWNLSHFSGKLTFTYNASDISGNSNTIPSFDNILFNGLPIVEQYFNSGTTIFGFSNNYDGGSNTSKICYSSSKYPALTKENGANANLKNGRINLNIIFTNSGNTTSCTYDVSSSGAVTDVIAESPITNNIISSNNSSVCTNLSETVILNGTTPSGGNSTYT